MFQTQPQGATTIGLTIRDNAPHSLQAQGQTLLNSLWNFHAIAAVAITHANPQRYAAIPTHPETEEHLLEIVPPVFAVPVGRPGSPWCLRCVLIGPIERNRRGVLMEPGRRNGIDFQRFKGEGAKHLVQIGGKQGIEDMP
jgi:hypothetical protein